MHDYPKEANMKKLCCFLSIAIAIATISVGQAYSQDEPAVEKPQGKFDPDRLFFGGSFGVTFGDFTFINLSPQVGYAFNQYLAAGGGINFIFSSDKVRGYNGQELYKQSSGFAGLNVFGRVYPIRFLFISAQPELNYSWGKIEYYNPPAPDYKLEGKFVPSLLLGGGVAIPAGRGAMLISAQYDVLYSDRTPYGNNIFFSFGYTF